MFQIRVVLRALQRLAVEEASHCHCPVDSQPRGLAPGPWPCLQSWTIPAHKAMIPSSPTWLLGFVRLVLVWGVLSSIPGQAAQQHAAQLFKVITAADSGTAFVIGPAENGRCVLLTAVHVIRVNASNEPLLFQSPVGSRLSLSNRAFTRDEDLDLAFVPLASCKDSLALPLARATSIVVSRKVKVMGYPVDMEAVQGTQVVPSIVNGRITQFNDLNGYDLNYDAATKPGYSGGPVISDEGDELLALHGFSDTVGNVQDPSLREQLRVGGRGISSALIYRFLQRHGYVLPRTSKEPCIVGVC
jgi:S1-C subfamily serine protease